MRQGSREPEVVVITGASAGVGRATALAFAREGARIALLARGRERLYAAAHEVKERGGEALPIPVDVADAQAVEEAAERVERELGPIDVWVNNAMTTVFAPVGATAPEEYRRATEVTYLGTVYGTMAALRRLRRRDRGAIVQVGSALSYRAIPLQAAYCGAKHAIRAFTDSLRTELLHDRSRIRLTMVQLPALNTPQFTWCRTKLPRQPQPVPPIYQPEVAADAIVWAAHHGRRELYVGGSSVRTIWANKVSPSLVDRFLARKGFAAQQTDGEVGPSRPDNLFEPAPSNLAAHGIFDDRARRRSRIVWSRSGAGWILAGLVVAGLAAAGAIGWSAGRAEARREKSRRTGWRGRGRMLLPARARRAATGREPLLRRVRRALETMTPSR